MIRLTSYQSKKGKNIFQRYERDGQHARYTQKGKVMEPSKASSVVLAGIINILVQHDALNNLDANMIVMEEDNKSHKARIESLED